MFIYLLRNKINGKCYVGQTTKDVNERLRGHRNKATCKTPGRLPITLAIRKHGWSAFDKFVLETCDTVEALDAAERYWITHYDCLAPQGYNLESGGGKAIREIHPETRRKLSEASRGRTMSEEAKLAIGNARRGHVKTEEEREFRSRLMKERGVKPPSRAGSTNSDEQKAKYAKTMSGENCHQAKLTWEKVREIRRLAAEGMTNTAIAKMFDIGNGTVGRIVRLLLWKPEFDPLNASVSAE